MSAAPFIELLRYLDSSICAQLPTHTLSLGGVPLPLCARNTGIYTGAAAAVALLWRSGRGRAMLPPPRHIVGILLAAIGAMAFDGFNSVAFDLGLPHLYTPQNALRLATGLVAGTALALLVAPVFARAIWGDQDERPSIAHLRQLLPFATLASSAYALIWSGPAWALDPVALVSNLGLLALLGEINLIAWLALQRAAGKAPTASLRRGLVSSVALLGVAELLTLATMRGVLLGTAAM